MVRMEDEYGSPGHDPAWPEPSKQGSGGSLRFLAGLGVAVCVVLVVVIIASIIRVPFFSEGPGPAHDVLPLIEVQGRQTYPTDGRLLLTTVSFSSDRLTALQYLIAQVDPQADVIPEGDLLSPGQTMQQESELEAHAMDQSQLEATAVALRALGDYPKEHGEGALVEGTLEGCEAYGELFPGNRIVQIDGQEVTGAGSARELIDGVPKGQPIEFTAKAGNKDVVVSLKRTACGPKGEDLVGVSLIDSFPVDVKIDDAGVGGPSAGLMFALGIYDSLTPGSLTDGRTIAGTGQIDLAGNVYPIGGVQKKIVGAQDAGASVFLVPRDNLAEARRAGIQDVQLVPVSSFDDALAYLTGDTVAGQPSAKEGD
jgi:Lon-like protease